MEQKHSDKIKELNITEQELLDAEPLAEAAWNVFGAPKWDIFFNKREDEKAHYLIAMVVATRKLKEKHGI